VSKAIARLERHFGIRLLSRGARGVSPTAAGRQVLPRIANAVAELRATAAAGRGESPAIELTIAGPSYLIAAVLPALVTLVPSVRLRGLELPPAHLRAYVAENVFDVALAPGGVDNRPAAWSVDMVGFCRSALLARPALAKRLGPQPLSPDRVRSLSFVGPARVSGERFAAVSDDCPLPWEKRWIALEAQAVATALEVVLRSDHVVFCPVLAASRLLASGDLVEVPVTGWEVQEPFHVLCNGDRVLARVRHAVLRAASDVLHSQAPCPGRASEDDARADRASDTAVALSS
jgi:DNA-binding transcriptional LysR family regulator